MNLSQQQAQKILLGNHTFSQLGFSMLLTRLKGLYAKDPSTDMLKSCTNEINAFLGKFQSIMIKDHDIIANL